MKKTITKAVALCALLLALFACTTAFALGIDVAKPDAGNVQLAKSDIFTAYEMPDEGAVTGVTDSDVLGCDIVVTRGADA